MSPALVLGQRVRIISIIEFSHELKPYYKISQAHKGADSLVMLIIMGYGIINNSLLLADVAKASAICLATLIPNNLIK